MRFGKFALVVLALVLRYPAQATVKATIEVPTLTLSTVRVHSLTVAKSSDLAIGTTTINAWMAIGTSALQRDDSVIGIPDTPCPVRIEMQGATISTFTSALSVVGSSQMYALRNIAAQVKLVSHIDWCDYTSVFNGCTDIEEYCRQIVVVETPAADLMTLTHELGHCQGDAHADSISGVVYKREIMAVDPGPLFSRNLVRPKSCRFFVR